MSDTPLEVIILAAGQGTRMNSSTPKVLHQVGGRPMLSHVIETAYALLPQEVHVVIGHGGERVRRELNKASVNWVVQEQQLGTGHAVDQAMPYVAENANVVILYGDVPLVRARTLDALVKHAGEGGLALLTVLLDDPSGYGRIVRDEAGLVKRIVEEKDADEDICQIREVNSGIMVVSAKHLRNWLSRLENSNAQKEFYLTDVIAMAVEDGVNVEAVIVRDTEEVVGINDRVQLARVERMLQRRKAEGLMHAGVTIVDPDRIDIRGMVEAGRDVTIDVGVVLEGYVRLGNGVHIGANCVLRDVNLEEAVEVLPMSVLEKADVGAGCSIGPFARVRPGTVLGNRAKVGNFVEIKNSSIGADSKINHLSYVGDTTMGAEVNIGAGTITCNYDGANKHRTTIGDRVFIGSDTQLVAPVEIGDDATIGAGSTITRDAPPGELSISRSKQQAIRGWKRPTKKR